MVKSTVPYLRSYLPRRKRSVRPRRVQVKSTCDALWSTLILVSLMTPEEAEKSRESHSIRGHLSFCQSCQHRFQRLMALSYDEREMLATQPRN